MQSVSRSTFVRLGFSLVMAIALCGTLSSCSSDADEQVIRATATAFLDSYKAPTRDEVVDLVDADTRRAYDQLDLHGVDGYAITQQYLAKFDYSIDKVAVKGDQATASVTMHNIDVAKAIDDTLAKYATDKGTETIEQIHEDGGDSAVYQLIYGELLDRLTREKEIVSMQTALTLTKTNGSWTVDEKCIPNVMGAIYGGTSLNALL